MFTLRKRSITACQPKLCKAFFFLHSLFFYRRHYTSPFRLSFSTVYVKRSAALDGLWIPLFTYGSCVADNDILYPLEDTITDNFLSRAISYPLKVFRGYKKYPVVV